MYITSETERLRIRPINLKDAEFMIDLVNSEGWLKFIGDRNISNLIDAENYIQKILDTPDFYYNILELKEPRRAIGVVTFLKREDEKFPDFGFALLPEFEKNGFAIEASRSYLEKIEHSKEYDNIIAITKPDNKKSIGLLQKLGLHYIGNHEKGGDTLSYYATRNSKDVS